MNSITAIRFEYPIRISSSPYFHVLAIEVIPNLIVLMLHTTDLISHHDDLILSSNITLTNFSMIEMHLAIHLEILVLAAHQILIELMSLDGNGRIVVEKQVK
jgi:hypothetical protein